MSDYENTTENFVMTAKTPLRWTGIGCGGIAAALAIIAAFVCLWLFTGPEGAIGLHSNDILAAGQDANRARTYGLHFREYYPIRELGICHYYLGNVELAKHYLAHSLAQAPSQRAQEYLHTLIAGQPNRQG